MENETHRTLFFLAHAAKIAERGRCFVSPNPVVGSVLVRNGKIIAKDWHRKYGEGHAERNLLEKFKGKILPDDVLYVTLEPCCHHGKTKPCTEIILSRGLKKVVIGLFDRNNIVNKKSVQLLRDEGVEVIVLEEAQNQRDEKVEIFVEKLKWQNRFFFKWIRTGIPWVALKIAQSLDGRVTPKRGVRCWLTGEESRRHVHEQRAVFDAILVGAGTVMVDDPDLSVRLSNSDKIPQPKVVVLDAALSVPLDRRVVRPGTIIFRGRQFRKRLFRKKELEQEGVEVIEIDTTPEGYLHLGQVLDTLGKRGISSVYVEGGPSVWSSFWKYDLVDELMLYMASKFLGSGLTTFDDLVCSDKLQLRDVNVLGDDVYWNGVRVKS